MILPQEIPAEQIYAETTLVDDFTWALLNSATVHKMHRAGATDRQIVGVLARQNADLFKRLMEAECRANPDQTTFKP